MNTKNTTYELQTINTYIQSLGALPENPGVLAMICEAEIVKYRALVRTAETQGARDKCQERAFACRGLVSLIEQNISYTRRAMHAEKARRAAGNIE